MRLGRRSVIAGSLRPNNTLTAALPRQRVRSQFDNPNLVYEPKNQGNGPTFPLPIRRSMGQPILKRRQTWLRDITWAFESQMRRDALTLFGMTFKSGSPTVQRTRQTRQRMQPRGKYTKVLNAPQAGKERQPKTYGRYSP